MNGIHYTSAFASRMSKTPVKRAMPDIILGTSSRTRRSIFAKMMTPLGYGWDVISADIDEKKYRSNDPELLTTTLAFAKAEAILLKLSELPRICESHILITADQVVVWKGKIREKPENEDQAREFLQGYNYAPAETVSAIHVLNTKNGISAEETHRSKVFFKPMPDSLIEAMIISGEVYKRAGAFVFEYIRDQGYIQNIQDIQRSEDSILGLPIGVTRRLLKKVAPNFRWDV